MKTLTLWQPWASLVAVGAKLVETRCWPTTYRGTLAIHSALRVPFKELGQSRLTDTFKNALQSAMESANQPKHAAVIGLPLGAVLCTVELYDVQEINETLVNELSDQERTFGNYDAGRYAWFLRNVEVFPQPIMAKGNRMLWNWEHCR